MFRCNGIWRVSALKFCGREEVTVTMLGIEIVEGMGYTLVGIR